MYLNQNYQIRSCGTEKKTQKSQRVKKRGSEQKGDELTEESSEQKLALLLFWPAGPTKRRTHRGQSLREGRKKGGRQRDRGVYFKLRMTPYTT